MIGFWNSISLIPISLSFLFLFQDLFAAPTRHLCHPEQRDAILEIKNEFKIQNPCIDGLPKTVSWVYNSDCCSWDSIRCDANFRDVIMLNLSDSCLHGQLNSKISIFRLQNLRFLTTLDLSNNDFIGKIPSSLGNFYMLTTLDLSRNHFSGEIPSSLGNLSKLATLDLSSNHFSGEIPASLGNLSKLTTLHLSHNNFTGRIPSSLGNLLNLTNLSLCANNFIGEIPSSFGISFSHLTSLSLCENNFGGEIPTSLGSLSHLTVLDLSQKNFVGEIPFSFGSLKTLTSLSVENNKLSGNFPLMLLNLRKLTELSLYGNKYVGKLPLNISLLSNLEFFYVSGNAFTGTTPSSLFSIPSLAYVDLSNNQLNGTLELGNISLSAKIEDLRLGNNNFMGSIPRSISKLSNLERLDLSHLNTQGCSGAVSDTEFPEFIPTQRNMKKLDISNNLIKGQVPGWLRKLPVLQYVNVSSSTLVGFGSPTNHGVTLSYLFAAKNNLTGKILSFICALRSLAILDLSNNKLNSSFPLCGRNFNSVLQTLNVRQNCLSGRLPEIITESIRWLDVGHNQLVGKKLPRSLIRNSFLEVLNVERNKFNDEFPSWLSSLQELQVLVLRSNAFHGPITKTGFPKLRILDMSSNHFKGILPSDFFVNWTAMFSLATEAGDQSNEKYMGSGYYVASMD
ncbi:hypothetical protein Bca52824_040540 [Brassica carinata]|uniref:Leucine-rich repeat-containing N-terminal plant-type domain-containing protein n=1 Tax=Brassica carinata TaxID=52824 RepID=A0A8X7UZ67_BRACI|nr:hypothetical protein Bca52824_040540 [Brassica carinata]